MLLPAPRHGFIPPRALFTASTITVPVQLQPTLAPADGVQALAGKRLRAGAWDLVHSRLAGSRGDSVEGELQQRAGQDSLRRDGDDSAPARHIGRTTLRPRCLLKCESGLTVGSRPRLAGASDRVDAGGVDSKLSPVPERRTVTDDLYPACVGHRDREVSARRLAVCSAVVAAVQNRSWLSFKRKSSRANCLMNMMSRPSAQCAGLRSAGRRNGSGRLCLRMSDDHSASDIDQAAIRGTTSVEATSPIRIFEAIQRSERRRLCFRH